MADQPLQPQSPQKQSTRQQTLAKKNKAASPKQTTKPVTTTKKKRTSSSPKHVPKKPAPRTTLRKHRRERYDTISQIYYRMAASKNVKRNLFRSFLLLIPIMLLLISTLWLWTDRRQGQVIIQSVDQGLLALEEDQLQTAANHFDYADQLYSKYHIKNPEWWWQQDTQIFTAMLRVTHAWRSLGEYQKAIRTFGLVAQHNSKGTDSWVGRQMKKDLEEFIHPSHWSEDELRDIYVTLLKTPVDSWEPCSLELIQAIEKLGLQIHPMQERIQEADLIGYGVPHPSADSEDVFQFNTIRFYKQDLPAEIIKVSVSPHLKPYEKDKLNWYLNSARECLLFLHHDNRPTLQQIDHILLSDFYSVNEFNLLLR